MRWGTETPRAAPLWIPAFAGMTRAKDPLRVPSGQASTGSGRTDLGSARAVGSGGCDGVGDAPRGAPLDSCLRRNDARGGVRAGEGCWWRRALRQAQGERTREARVRWGVGDAMGWETPRASPLWIPAFAGMSRAEGPLRVPSGQASTGSGRTDFGSARAVGSGGAMGWETPRAAPLWIPAFAGMTRAEGPLRVLSGQASTGSGRTGALPTGPLPWIP